MTDQQFRVGGAPDTVDDLLRPPEPITALSSLREELQAAVAAEVHAEPITLVIPRRPSVSVRYATDLDDEQLTAWRKRCADKKKPDGFDAMKFSTMVLASQCEAILINGEEPTDANGEPYTFATTELADWLGVVGRQATSTVRVLYGGDPHVLVHSNYVLEAAGFGDAAQEAEAEDPTARSSSGSQRTRG